MKKTARHLPPEERARLRAKQDKRWLKLRGLLFPAFTMFIFTGGVIGGVVAQQFAGNSGILIGGIMGMVLGFFCGGWFVVHRSKTR